MRPCLRLLAATLSRLGVLAAVWSAAPARASPPPATAVTIVPADDEVPPALLEALRFEAQQAGFELLADSAEPPAEIWIYVDTDAERWSVDIEHRTHALRIGADGPTSDSPNTVALVAIERLVESTLGGADVDTPDEGSPEHPAAPDPTTAAESQTRIGVDETPPEAAPAEPQLPVSLPPPPPRRWAIELGVVGASLGPIGGAIAVQHQWSRAWASLHAEAAFVPSAPTERAGPAEIQSAGIFRTRLAGGYVFRDGARWRPQLGAAFELGVPLVRSHFEDDARRVGGLEYGIVGMPELELGVSVELRRPLSLAFALRGGPLLELASLPLADGRRFVFPPYFLAGTLSLRFAWPAPARSVD